MLSVIAAMVEVVIIHLATFQEELGTSGDLFFTSEVN
jgi:hypothetical protein